MRELMEELFSLSKSMVLDFSKIPSGKPDHENIQKYFEACEAQGINPRSARSRQLFNNRLLDESGKRYLISHYGEDRSSMLTGSSIAKEGRTLHLGIDIFCRDLELVYAPFDGEIVQVGREPEHHSFGYYSILKSSEDQGMPYMFLGHLGTQALSQPGKVKAGDVIGRLGDFATKENGGWSRHLHVQMCADLPLQGVAPVGYATEDQFEDAQKRFPSPFPYFPDWKIEDY